MPKVKSLKFNEIVIDDEDNHKFLDRKFANPISVKHFITKDEKSDLWVKKDEMKRNRELFRNSRKCPHGYFVCKNSKEFECPEKCVPISKSKLVEKTESELDMGDRIIAKHAKILARNEMLKQNK